MIEVVVLENAGPFRGRHEVALVPGAHAVVARHALDPRRSSGTGKSFLLECVAFGLYGRWRRERGFDADGWVTRGEREGRVLLRLEGGAEVERWKRRGQPRQLRVRLPGRAEAAQDTAQGALDAWLGLGEADFRRAAYAEQGAMAALLRIDPADRLSVVAGWLGLGVAERAEERAREVAATAAREGDLEEGKLEAFARANAFDAPGEDEPALLARAHALGAEVLGVRERRRAERLRADAARFLAGVAELVERGKAARAEVEREEPGLEAEVEAAEDAAAAARSALDAERAERDRRSRVALGLFDGRCPVAEIACPARNEINSDRQTARRLLGEAEATLKEARRRHEEAVAALAPLRGRLDRARAAARELARLRSEYERAEPRVGEAEERAAVPEEDDEALAAEEARLLEERARLQERAQAARRARERAEGEAGARAEAEARHGAARARQRAAARAAAIFRAAQRRVAERALVEVEDAANGIVAEVRPDLRLEARWEREGKGRASACEDCGAAFPASARVKACERCGAPRGFVVSQRLDFVQSDSSGGLDDLAGLAWQLAAGEWLLRSRSSPWATLIVDEPTAAMDAPMRRGLIRYLAGASRRGWRQILVVAHTMETVDALPRRVIITCAADGGRRIEVA